MPRVVCIGGATVDRKLRLAGPFVAGTSNPVAVTGSFGGVARNVAENLARLGVEVALVTAVGRDAAGDAVLADLAAVGVDTSAAVSVDGVATAQYDAVLAPDGALVAGFAAMDVFAALTPAFLAGLAPDALAVDWIFADANLSMETLAALPALRGGGRLAVDAVSVAKAPRLAGLGPDLMFLNADEAATLLGHPDAPAEMAADLLDHARAVVLTLGAEGALIADAAGVRPVGAVTAAVVDVTGAGDALVAGTLAGLVGGRDLDAAVADGSRVAARTIESEATVRVDIAEATR